MFSKYFLLGSSLSLSNERTEKLLIFLNVLLFQVVAFGFAIILDLYLFQEISLLNPYLIFPKKFMLSFKEKVATRT